MWQYSKISAPQKGKAGKNPGLKIETQHMQFFIFSSRMLS